MSAKYSASDLMLRENVIKLLVKELEALKDTSRGAKFKYGNEGPVKIGAGKRGAGKKGVRYVDNDSDSDCETSDSVYTGMGCRYGGAEEKKMMSLDDLKTLLKSSAPAPTISAAEANAVAKLDADNRTKLIKSARLGGRKSNPAKLNNGLKEYQKRYQALKKKHPNMNTDKLRQMARK